MNKILQHISIAGVAFLLIFTGCTEKTEVNPENPTNNNTTNNASFSFPNSYGTLVAVKSISYQVVAGIQIPIEVNTATAAFPSAPGSSTFVDAGGVTINTKAMTKNTNNSYVYDDLVNPLDFNNVTWNVAGGNSIPAFNYTDDNKWPSFSGFDALPATVTKSTGLTVALGNAVMNADSIYVIVADGNGEFVLKRYGGNVAQATVTSNDLSSVASGTGMIQVVPWNFDMEDFSSKDFYFVLEAVYSKMNVTIN